MTGLYMQQQSRESSGEFTANISSVSATTFYSERRNGYLTNRIDSLPFSSAGNRPTFPPPSLDSSRLSNLAASAICTHALGKREQGTATTGENQSTSANLHCNLSKKITSTSLLLLFVLRQMALTNVRGSLDQSAFM